MMVSDAVHGRFSCRSYMDRPVEKEVLDIIFEAARLAPSAKNMQDWRFVVVTGKEIKRKVIESTNKPDIFNKAPVVIVACSVSDYVMGCGQPAGPIDVAIAMEHIALQATELGLATCWIGSFEPRKVRDVLGIPDNVPIVELMTLGYPAEKGGQPQKKLLKEIFCYEKWQF